MTEKRLNRDELEELLEQMNCRYRGCTVILDRRLMAAHEAACPRRPA